jgi:hypothetical protein
MCLLRCLLIVLRSVAKAAWKCSSERGGKKDKDDESSSQSQRNDSNTSSMAPIHLVVWVVVNLRDIQEDPGIITRGSYILSP